MFRAERRHFCRCYVSQEAIEQVVLPAFQADSFTLVSAGEHLNSPLKWLAVIVGWLSPTVQVSRCSAAPVGMPAAWLFAHAQQGCQSV